MATEKWVLGAVTSWTAAYTAAGAFDSLASGNALISDLQIDNSSNLDEFCQLAIILGSAAFVAPNFVGCYLYDLTQDASTYGDGRFTTTAAGPPPTNYCVANIGIVAATQAQTGASRIFMIPPTKFKFVLWNQGGVAWAGSSANKLYYRTYNRAIA